MSALSPQDLGPEEAMIFRITHVANIKEILENGLHSQTSSVQDPSFVPIGNQELITKRTSREVPAGPGGTLADYVPFYFTPWSPMLMNILTGRNVSKRRPEEIVFIVTSLPTLEAAGLRYVIADRHAYLLAARFAEDRSNLEDMVPWSKLQARDFQRNPEEPEAFDRYQAEALVHQHLPIDSVLGLACYTQAIQSDLDHSLDLLGVELPTAVRTNWYFR